MELHEIPGTPGTASVYFLGKFVCWFGKYVLTLNYKVLFNYERRDQK